jgi:hypothetical protein
MKTLWLVREPCTVLFDVKPIHEALGTEKMDSSIEVELTNLDYDRYLFVVKLYNEWQEILEQKYIRKIV